MHTSRTSGTSRTRASHAASDTTRMTARYRDKNVNGTGAASILHPKDPRAGRTKDHFRANITALRERQRENRLRKELESLEEEAAGSFKLKRFHGVESKVKVARSMPSSAASTSSKQYLRKAEGKTAATAKPAPKPAGPFRRPPRTTSKPRVPRADEVAPLAPREDKDFVRENYRKAPQAAGRRPPRGSSAGSDGSPTKRKGYGEVPSYLQARKEEWADEAAARAAAEESTCPPGMTVMPEEERLETLAVLQDSLAEANNMLVKMPLQVETPGQIRRKAELEAKIKELEDAVGVFSRDVVFVEED